MKGAVRGLLLVVVAVAGARTGAQQPTAADLFHQGLMLERADGKTADAIFLYERIVAEFPKDAEIVPQALYHLGELYEQQTDPRALVVFSRLVNDYPANRFASTARDRIAAIQVQAAGPFKERDITATLRDAWTRTSGMLPALAFSPDGRWAAFGLKQANQNADPGHVSLLDLTSGKTRSLFASATGRASYLHWSPDCSRIAFEVRFPSPDGPAAPVRRELHIVTIATGQDRVVHQAAPYARTTPTAGEALYRLEWSPDSRMLAFDPTLPSDVRIFTIASGQLKSLGPATDKEQDFGWSPDFRWSAEGGRLFLHARNTAAHTESLRIVTIATGEVREIEIRGREGASISLGDPKGNDAIAIWQRGPVQGVQDVSLLPLAGGPLKLMCAQADQGDTCMGIRNDGETELVWKKASTSYVLRRVSTGVETKLTLGSGEERSAKSSPDGKLVTFASNRDGRWAQYVVAVDAIPTDAPVRLGYFDSAPEGQNPAIWSTDGRLVIGQRIFNTNVYRVAMDAAVGRAIGPPERLTQDTPNNTHPQVAQDSRHISYLFRNGSHAGVAVMDANGANERPVLEAPFSEANPRWQSATEIVPRQVQSPQGIQGPRRVTIPSIDILTGRQSTVAQIEFPDRAGSYSDNFTYIPQARELYYVVTVLGGGDTLRVRSLSDGRDRTIVTARNIDEFSVSADGRLVAVGYQLDAGKPYEIHILSADGVEQKMLYRAPGKDDSTDLYPGGWSSDGRFLLFTEDGDSTFIKVAEVATGRTWRLVESDVGGLNNTDEAVWAPDGSFVVFASFASREHWRLWDGVTTDTVKKMMAAKRR